MSLNLVMVEQSVFQKVTREIKVIRAIQAHEDQQGHVAKPDRKVIKATKVILELKEQQVQEDQLDQKAIKVRRAHKVLQENQSLLQVQQ